MVRGPVRSTRRVPSVSELIAMGMTGSMRVAVTAKAPAWSPPTDAHVHLTPARVVRVSPIVTAMKTVRRVTAVRRRIRFVRI